MQTPGGRVEPGAVTVNAAIRSAARDLDPSSTARLDAEVLMSCALETDRAAVLARGRDPVPTAALAVFESLVSRRAAGEPLAYLCGRAHFHDVVLAVTPAVLVPRPETELLVDWALDWLAGRPGARTVLDVGTGSGAVALALAQDCARTGRRVAVHATEIAPDALEVARNNASRLGLLDAVTFHRADLLPPGSERFDLVLANLPYVGRLETADVDHDTLAWEPHGALFAGPDGLRLIRRLLERVPDRVAPGGGIGLEIGWRQGERVVSLARRAFPGAAVSLHPDFAGHDRLVAIETDRG